MEKKEQLDWFYENYGVIPPPKKKKKPPPKPYPSKKVLEKYGMTLEGYNRMKKFQENQCGICKKEKKLIIDHCHKTGRVRMLLCNSCNMMLGLSGDNPIILQAGVFYLKKFLWEHTEENSLLLEASLDIPT